MDANDLDKKVPGSKLVALGAVFMLIGSICSGLAFLLALFGFWYFFLS